MRSHLASVPYFCLGQQEAPVSCLTSQSGPAPPVCCTSLRLAGFYKLCNRHYRPDCALALASPRRAKPFGRLLFRALPNTRSTLLGKLLIEVAHLALRCQGRVGIRASVSNLLGHTCRFTTLCIWRRFGSSGLRLPAEEHEPKSLDAWHGNHAMDCAMAGRAKDGQVSQPCPCVRACLCKSCSMMNLPVQRVQARKRLP